MFNLFFLFKGAVCQVILCFFMIVCCIAMATSRAHSFIPRLHDEADIFRINMHDVRSKFASRLLYVCFV